MHPSAEARKDITSQIKVLLKQYQDKTTVLDSTIDVLNNELDTIREDVTQDFKIHSKKIITTLREELMTQPPAPTTQHPVTP